MLIVVLKQEVRITMPESKNNMQREGENVSTIKPISRVWSIKLIRFFFSFFNHPSCETNSLVVTTIKTISNSKIAEIDPPESVSSLFTGY